MKSSRHLSIAYLPFLVAGISLVALPVGCGEDDPASSPPTKNSPAERAKTSAATPPVVTIDLLKFTTQIGTAYQVQADAWTKMAKGTSLTAEETLAYFESQRSAAEAALVLSDNVDKHPRWQRQVSEALTANAKKGIIAQMRSERAFAKAKKSGKVGTMTGQCPADVKKYIADNHLVIARIVHTMLSYSKDELEGTDSKASAPANTPQSPAKTADSPAKTP
ncbi:MAG: hypothetical protein EXS01_02745 [Phycisphaerales bacterium]|nr:hypothetical protein [Phycisphaerales bacterium]